MHQPWTGCPPQELGEKPDNERSTLAHWDKSLQIGSDRYDFESVQVWWKVVALRSDKTTYRIGDLFCILPCVLWLPLGRRCRPRDV